MTPWFDYEINLIKIEVVNYETRVMSVVSLLTLMFEKCVISVDRLTTLMFLKKA